jgi:hypothetical protein
MVQRRLVHSGRWASASGDRRLPDEVDSWSSLCKAGNGLVEFWLVRNLWKGRRGGRWRSRQRCLPEKMPGIVLQWSPHTLSTKRAILTKQRPFFFFFFFLRRKGTILHLECTTMVYCDQTQEKGITVKKKKELPWAQDSPTAQQCRQKTLFFFLFFFFFFFSTK